MFRHEHAASIFRVEEPGERERWYVIGEVGSGTGIRTKQWTPERTSTLKIGTADSFETTRRQIPFIAVRISHFVNPLKTKCKLF